MLIITVFLIIGIIIGYFSLLPDKIMKLSHYLILGGLFILLFVMGFEIGSNEKILSNLNQIGLQALLLAGASIVGSLMMVFLFSAGIKEE